MDIKGEAIKCLGSDALIKALEAEKVEYIFGYPGGAIMPVYDALMREKHTLNHILVRHEQGAIHAAQGYNRAHPDGKPGVCLVTSGPGATNLITGLADAYIDNTAIICITGQVPANMLGTDAFQETDIITLSAPVTKWSYRIESADEIAETIASAFYIATTGRTGPVLVDITKNAQVEMCSFQYTKKTYYPRYTEKFVATEAKNKQNKNNLKEAAALINAAKNPLALIGQGLTLANAQEEFIELIEKASIPFASTLLGLSSVPHNHRLNQGMLGMHGNVAPNLLTQQCDVLIAIGMRFDDRVTGNTSAYARQAKIIHFEIDESEINKIIPCHVPIIGNCKEMLQDIIPLIEQKADRKEWMGEFTKWRHREDEQVINPILYSSKVEIKMGEAIDMLNKSLTKPATVVTDVGQHQMVASRYFSFNAQKSQITSGGLGTMGFGLPAAMGAALGNPHHTTIAIVGDGGMQMTIQELGTIAQSQIPVKIIILNNNFLGMVRQWQELFFERRYSFTDLINPDFVKIGEAYKIPSFKIEDKKNLKEQLHKYIEKTEGPVLIDVVIEREENVYPMIPSGAKLQDMVISSKS